METPTAWMLVTNAHSAGQAIPLSARVGEGVRGNAVRRVDVPDGSADLRLSAERATRLVYEVLHREKYVSRQIVVSYQTGASVVNVHGRSAELAFALAIAMGVRSGARSGENGCPSVAATGILGEDGAILPVEKLPEKIAAALNAQQPVSLILFPAGNASEIPIAMTRQAAARGTALRSCVRLEEALRHCGLAISRTWLESPFRGLEPFEFRHAPIFFGREKEIEEILALLHRRAEKGPAAVLVKGPSGSGKSSLVLAGVIPALVRRRTLERSAHDVRWGLLRPRAVEADVDPVREIEMLGAALRSAWRHGDEGGLFTGPEKEDVGAADLLEPSSLLAWLREQSVTPAQTRHVLVLDQMEAWLQGRLQPQTIQQLCRVLVELVQNGVWLIATLTNAAYPLLREHSELAAIFGIEGQYALDPQHSIGSLEAVIREPAKAAGLRFEPGLDTELFAAASHAGADILPLLELLLTELYERRDPSRNELRLGDYRDVGGLEGVISARAEVACASVSAEAREIIWQLLWKLVTSEEIQPSEYPADHPMQELVTAFRTRRLLVEDDDGDKALHAAHEALFRHWPRAIDYQRANEADIGLWLDLNRESSQWARRQRALIPPGPQLQAATALVQRRRPFWTASDRQTLTYVERSAQQRSRRQMLAYLAIGVPLAGVAAIGAKAGYDFIESRYVTRIDFQDVSVPAGKEIAADAYLHHKGISITSRSPANSRVVIVDSLGLYTGRAIDSNSGGNVLTQQVDDQTAPISFTLTFEEPVKSVNFRRAALFAATASGVTHPAWKAHALDNAGKEVATVRERLLAEYHDIPAKTYVLRGANHELIRGIQIISDYRDRRGVPFAGFHAVLISGLDLVHA